MKSGGVFAVSTGSLCLLAVMTGSVASSSSSGKELQKSSAEERELKMLSSTKVKTFTDSKGGGAALIFGNTLKAVGVLKTTDYSKMEPDEAIKTVADIVLPVIIEGLAFIPGWGPVISGILSGVWGLTSSLLGERHKSPLEKLAEKMEEEFENVRREMQEMRKDVIDISTKHTEQRLGQVMAAVIGAEMNRNRYVCDKYAAASEEVTTVLKGNHNISDTLRLENVIYLHDCDNFLKDTATAFMEHAAFADLLWIPSVMTTLARVSFLTEVVNHGRILRLKNRVLVPMWNEIKSNIRNQLAFYGHYVAKRLESLRYADSTPPGNLTGEEFEMCKVQQSLLFVDLDLYPYGVPPHKQILHNLVSHVHLDQFINASQVISNPVHIQIFYKHPRPSAYDYADFINCFAGPILARAPKKQLITGVTFLTNKSYVLRVLYVTQNSHDRIEKNGRRDRATMEKKGVTLSLRKLTDKNAVEILMEQGDPNPDFERHVYPTQYFDTSCGFDNNCPVTPRSYGGKFIVESVQPFAILPEKDELTAKGRITIQNKQPANAIVAELLMAKLAIIGFELIVLPLI